MSGEITYFSPANAGFSGGKIGVAGNTLWILARKITPSFSQKLVRVDPVNGSIAFWADRDITGLVQCEGIYESVDGHLRSALACMQKEGPITGVTIQLDTGVTLVGDVVVYNVSDLADINQKDSAIPYRLSLHFTGEVVGDGGSSDGYEVGTSEGTIYTNLKSVTYAVDQEYTRGYVDQRGDRAREPFAIVGIRENSGVPLATAEALVVAELGGAAHKWRGDATLPFDHITARWAGFNLIVGDVHYNRNATDCRSHQIRWDIGYIVKGSVGEIVTGDSGSDPDNVCTALASGPFAIRFVHWRNRVLPYRIAYLPCVFDANPFLTTGLAAMIGTINNASVVIDGETIAATEARFDGVSGVEKITGPTGSKYFGWLKIAILSGGWTDGTLTCARLVPLPITNGGAAPSYTVEASVIRLFDYERVTWRTIVQLCPNCYS